MKIKIFDQQAFEKFILFLIGFSIVFIPYEGIIWRFKLYNIIILISVLYYYFYFGFAKVAENLKNNFIFIFFSALIFLPSLFFELESSQYLEKIFKFLNIISLLITFALLFNSKINYYFMFGVVLLTVISSLVAIFQYLDFQLSYDLRFVFQVPKNTLPSYFLERPPGISFTSIQLSTILIISINFTLILKKKFKTKFKSYFLDFCFLIFLITPFLIVAKILVILNFFILIFYLYQFHTRHINYLIKFTLVFFYFLILTKFIIVNMNAYINGLNEKYLLVEINFKSNIYANKYLKETFFKDRLNLNENCELNETYEQFKKDFCDNQNFKKTIILEKNIKRQNLLPVLMNYGSHNSNINALSIGGVLYFLSTILYKFFLFALSIFIYQKKKQLRFLIYSILIVYLEIYTNLHNAGLSTFSIIYCSTYFYIFIDLTKNLIKKKFNDISYNF
jgi:hypothetical protein